MKFYTKTIAAILLVCVLLSVSACGDTNTDPSAEAPTTEAPTTVAPTTEAPSEEPTENELDDNKVFSAGTIDGNTYTNEFIGVSCTLDESWTISSKEELAQQMGITDSLFTDEKVSDMIENSGAALIFMAMRNDGAGINITVGDTKNILAGVLTDSDTLVDQMIEQMPELLASSGMEVVECRGENVTFCGEETYAIYLHSTFSGLDIYQRQILLIKGKYAVTITISTYAEDFTKDLLPLFTAI